MDAQQINSVVDHLAAKLAVPSERIIQAYALQGPVHFITALVLLAIAGLTLFLNREPESEGTRFLFCLSAFVGSVALLGATVTLPDFLVWWQSPEAYAIVTIVEKLR